MTVSRRKPKRPAKNPAAVRLAARRSAKLSASRRGEIARQAALARWAARRPSSRGAIVPTIEEIAAELTRDIPPEEWNRLPADLIDQLDHYLYGQPGR